MNYLLTLALLLSTLTLHAQDTAPAVEDTIHQELREARENIIAAIESRDLDRMLAYVHPDVVVTWQNGETTHGIAELRSFYDRLGKDAFVGYKVPYQPDSLSIIHGGDTAISAGKVVADYQLLGRDYELTSRWTATLVREDGKWIVAAYHVSLNALDNPILSTAKSMLWIAGLAGILVGLLVGGAAVFLRNKRSKSA